MSPSLMMFFNISGTRDVPPFSAMVNWLPAKCFQYRPHYSFVVGSNLTFTIFMAFVEDNATMSSIRCFENHESYFVQNKRK